MPKSPLETLPSLLAHAAFDIAKKIQQAGGRAILVGGCVRDAARNEASEEADIEVYGLSPSQLEQLLAKDYPYHLVGKAFAVLKLKGIAIDISLPRRESKIDKGHRGFAIQGDPFMSLEEASSRRDFTINAIAYDPLLDKWLDPHQGLKDLQNNRLRHVSSAFCEDPLRVLRAMQFIARFECQIAKETLILCQNITPESLSQERIFEEWKKLILKGRKPSLGLTFLKNSGWVQYFPELKALIGCQQDPLWHPEGDVWQHSGFCMDAFAEERVQDDWENLVVGLAVLCHDFGKPLCTQTVIDGRIRSPGHDVAGEAPTRSFLRRMTNHKELVESVVALVLTHMRPTELFKANATDAAIRRLSAKVERIDRLVRVVRADKGGRPPLPRGDCQEGQWLLERAEALQVAQAKPKPILLGRHLLELGMPASPQFKPLLEAAYEAQLDGKITTIEEAIHFIQGTLTS